MFQGDGVDAWLLPLDPTVPRRRDQPRTSAATIPAPGDPDYENEIGFTPLASFLGLPAIAFPIGTSRSGAPLAAQLVGPPGSEPVLISLAADIANSLPRL
jgi:Asp-tRNA(Asn)/Glu-tRNA(Gln) amidotransferase A subunit family amidase